MLLTVNHLSYFQAIVMGLLQGVTELFPVSSLGHGVIVPGLLHWNNMVSAQTSKESFFLAFLVALHVGTAIGLIIYYFSTWRDIVRGTLRQLGLVRRDGISALTNLDNADPNYRLLVLLIIATIPVGLVGLVFEHKLRVLFAKPSYAAGFLVANGFLMAGGELLRRRSMGRHAAAVRIESTTALQAATVGSSQILALFAGISRSGASMVAGLLRGYSHEDAARFSFLLATPVILLAGVYKITDFVGPNGDGVRLQSLVGAVVAGVAAYLSVRFLSKWFSTRTLWPFAIYSVIAGGASLIYFAN